MEIDKEKIIQRKVDDFKRKYPGPSLIFNCDFLDGFLRMVISFAVTEEDEEEA